MKRSRVKKGPYNTYLREDSPIHHAPSCSKKKLEHDKDIPEHDDNRTDCLSGSGIQEMSTNTTTESNGVGLEVSASADGGNSDNVVLDGELVQIASENGDSDTEPGQSDGSNGLMQTQQQHVDIIHSNHDHTGGEFEFHDTNTAEIYPGVDSELEDHSMDVSVQDIDDFAQFQHHQHKYEMAHDIRLNLEVNNFEETRDVNVPEETAPAEDSNEPKGTAYAPVHSDTSLTIGAGMLLIAKFAQKASLTGESLQLLLDLIDSFCPPENGVPKTVRQFQKWFQDIKTPLIFHKYCSNCHTLIKGDNAANVCSNDVCKADLSQRRAVSHFIEIPIVDQVQALFRRPSFIKDIQYRFNRNKDSPDSIEDIYDGQLYKSLAEEGGILDDPHNISLLWNTDGIPCFNSSNMSLWPLFFQVNELSFPKRSDPNNMILGGLWFGSKKPTIMSYTEPLLKSLQDLEEVGIDIMHNEHGEIFNSKVIVIGGTADLPARSIVCNSVEYNGKFGCNKCLQPGETFKTGPRGDVHVFPFQSEQPDGPPRTHAKNIQHSFEAIQTGKPCYGIKGPTFLQCLKYHDLVGGICIDYMHGVLLGTTKLLLSLWFRAEHKGELFSLSEFVDLVDNRLNSIKPPNTIKRTPRSIQEHLKHWKASELRSWLLYYSVPILRDIQEERYFQHYLLLVEAIFILLQDNISVDKLAKSDSLLKYFCCMFSALYGERYMTCNLHQLLHLPKMVLDMGPLLSCSCFPFENANGVLLKLFHGTQNIDVQIPQSVCMMQRLPELENDHMVPGSREMELLNAIKGVPNRNDKLLMGNVYAVGAFSRHRFSEEKQAALVQFLGYHPTEYLTFKRMRIGSEMFHSEMYQRCSARNSYTIVYQTTTDIRLDKYTVTHKFNIANNTMCQHRIVDVVQ